MNWEVHASDSEKLLASSNVPSSLEIITLIKKVNPTHLALCERDRQRGYRIKSRLQSLLLEHYGDSFRLVSHPASPNIILIKHRVLPTIDACHANLSSLSAEAMERVEEAVPAHCAADEAPRKRGKKRPPETAASLSPKGILRKAQALLDEYDYAAAEELLAGLQAVDHGDAAAVVRAADILLHDIGVYGRCIEMILRQPKHLLKDRKVREVLAVAYHSNGSLAEARAILEGLPSADLGVEAVFAHADIAFKDGNLCAAWELVKLAKGKEGFIAGMDALQKELESVMSAQAEPTAQMAQAALRSGAVEEARRLARKAVERYPNCREARAVISAVEAIDEEAKVAGLWARLENEQDAERRMALLSTLHECDKEQKDAVARLIAEEKALQRRRLFDDRLASLRDLVAGRCWADCFDAVADLMKQPDFPSRAGEVISLSPLFSVLHENRRLHGPGAKDLWLRFVKAKSAFDAGNGEGSFETFEELKPWFMPYPQFKDAYLELLNCEQEKARKEIGALLEACASPESTVVDVRLSYGCIRKKMPVLPMEERRELTRTMEERLARLLPEQGPDRLLEEYREALRIGNGEKVGYLRAEITDTAALEAVEAEFASSFHIDRKPLTLEFSDDIPIDLITPPTLIPVFSSDDRLIVADGEDALIMIDFEAKGACRVSSPVFAHAAAADCTTGGTVLFVESAGDDRCGDHLWRAKLTLEEAVAVATFNMRERFEIEEGTCIDGVFASSDKDTDYYVLLRDQEGRQPAQMLRKRLVPKATVESLQMGNLTKLNVWRWGSHPDRFLVGGVGLMKRVNRNLSVKTSLKMTPKVYSIDNRNGRVWGLDEAWLTQRNENLELVRAYQSAPSLGLFEVERIFGWSAQTETTIVVMGNGKQAFFNFGNNTFSNKVRVGRVFPSERDGKWYCYDYDKEKEILRLRDISSDIHTMLEWREFFFPHAKQKKMRRRLLWFNQEMNFLYRPEEWGPPDPQPSEPVEQES